jgi:hypothetical protein
MQLSGFLSPILAHAEESMSLGELLISIGLLVLCIGLIASMLMLVLVKRFRRRQRLRRDGALAPSSKAADYAMAGVVAVAFVVLVWKFAWAAYYDYHYQKFEEKLEASGKHPQRGAEFKWERWHINARYGGEMIVIYVDDILEKAEPRKMITASAREVSPKTTEWQAMTWDEKQKAFTAAFKPEGEKMEFEFEFKSGWSSYQNKITGYVPRNPMKGHEGLDVAK